MQSEVVQNFLGVQIEASESVRVSFNLDFIQSAVSTVSNETTGKDCFKQIIMTS